MAAADSEHQTQAQHTVVPTREGYDRWSPVYDGDGNPLVALEERYVRPMLGNLRGLRVADVGCGTGRHALRMAREGAVVTGLDFSGGMLEQARSKASDPSHGPLPVSFIEHDLSRPLPLEDSAFDRVLCALVLDHIQDVQSLMAEFRRICAPSGFILISVMHPAMMLRGVQARFDDTATGGKTLPASVPNLVSDYVMGAVRAGLSIEAMHEHAADAELVRQAPRAEKHLGWPMLLVMKLRRGG